jgi:hypothetical protein
LPRNNRSVYQYNIGISTSHFATNSGQDSNNSPIATSFTKWVPYIKIVLREKDTQSTTRRWFDLRSFIITEGNFNYAKKAADNAIDAVYYPVSVTNTHRYFNQYSYHVENNRVLYPYHYQLQLQHSESFYKTSITGNYWFNYEKGGGLNVRVYGCKFGYIGEKTIQKINDNYIYQPKLTAVGGNEDYS